MPDHLDTKDPEQLIARISALSDALARERALFSGGPVVVFRWVARDGWPVEYVSSNVHDLFGWSGADFLSGRVSYANVIHEDDLARVAEEVRVHSEAGVSTFEQDYRIRCADGRVRWLYDCTAVVRNERGDITHYDGYVLDISARREAEAAVRSKDELLRHAQKMEALGRLAGGVAHDFNNILTAILGHADLVRLHLPQESPAMGSLDVVIRSAERAADLTRQLLAFSRRQVLEALAMDAVALVADTFSMLGPLLGEHLDLRLELGDPLPVRVDRTQLEQVLVNLALNARDAMPSGGTLEILTGEALVEAPLPAAMNDLVPPGRYARLVVRDTGVGMDSDTLGRIFEPFFTTRGPDGTGLGLATVYGIVRQSNGFVRVESQPGLGSTFEVLLPLLSSLPAEQARAPFSKASLDGTETVLLVEDHPDILAVMATALLQHGYAVLTATDGLHALEVLGSGDRHVDVLVTDVVMPRLGGLGLVTRLLAEDRCPPVVFVSGYTDLPLSSVNIPYATVQKPFTPEVLLRRLRTLLETTTR
jgi:two-component system cell cycle sensor histidine kinase/response regulator CckA